MISIVALIGIAAAFAFMIAAHVVTKPMIRTPDQERKELQCRILLRALR